MGVVFLLSLSFSLQQISFILWILVKKFAPLLPILYNVF
ncbi:Hypothetical protein LDBND_1714 [Lactobacillus delbrueckii subsp. bulgaricus ND02]|nr:Hypothetical protein LDBND_1714 [Lactobacillus delbrueckii subsp. bulgaricus ND02]AQR54429.1 hypothetical protein BBD26_1202 [Lactobacillus delbrueckii subsp. bulgaricus]EHE87917.1 hypothetical protein LDBUL1632_01574 [Lactobacillus delbrueckii subsp. bulgaricus CNCM I-1632]EPB98039.1 putative membrane protein [Lactobacillus delbrueckii subsp. lactis CRL581]